MVMEPVPVLGLVAVVVRPVAAITVAGLTAAAGPWLRTVAVRVMVALGVVVAGPVRVILRSALLTTTGVTVTVNVPVPVLPAASVAVQVTVVVPTGKVDPDAGVQVGVSGPSRSSLAEAV